MRGIYGAGLEFDAACAGCTASFQAGEKVEWVEVCAACCDEFLENEWYFSWVGEAQILENPMPFNAALVERHLPLENDAVLAVAENGRVFEFADGSLSEIGEEKRLLMRVEWPREAEPKWGKIRLVRRLEVSESARFLALINDFGRYGVVVDLQTCAVILQLDRGDYHPEQTPFPLAFFQDERRELVVHGADWNRLDISDPSSGELISVRESPRHDDESESSHYLDYFHGRLRVSPDGEWILDDGWIWHPMGVPAWWNLKKWDQENVWESEDGPSRVDPTFREFWDCPMCWIGDESVAISGIGNDDEGVVSGVQIFSLDGKEVFAFAGPSGKFFSDGKRLFSVEGDGLQIWNVETGARTGTIAGFHPQFQIDSALVEIKNQKMRIWNYGDPQSESHKK